MAELKEETKVDKSHLATKHFQPIANKKLDMSEIKSSLTILDVNIYIEQWPPSCLEGRDI